MMKLKFAKKTSSSNFPDIVLFLLLSLVTGPSFMSILLLVLELQQFLFIRDLTIFLSNIWRLGQVRVTKFGMKVSNKKLFNPSKCQVYKILKENQPRGEGRGVVKIPPPRLALNECKQSVWFNI